MRLKLFVLAVVAASALAATPEQDVQGVLETQVAAWNRGDLEAFVATYSAESVFVTKEIARGDKQVLERYKRSYTSQEKMGVLRFSDLEVRVLGVDYASVIGRFQLKRTAAGGGDAAGIFTLLLRNTPQGWKIILDHTS